jgi:hypothetical protein
MGNFDVANLLVIHDDHLLLTQLNSPLWEMGLSMATDRKG